MSRRHLVSIVLLGLQTAGFGGESSFEGDQPPPPAANQMLKAPAGPWGNIEFCYFHLEAPDNLVERFPLPSPRTRWIFPSSEAPSIAATLEAVEIPDYMVSSLVAPENTVTADGRLHLFPGADVLNSLRPDTRAKLYAVLRNNGLNTYHQNPILILSGNVDAWALDSGLSPDAVAIIRNHAYPMNGVLAFSDVALLLSTAGGESEARLMFKKLTRVRTLMARLKIDQDADIQALLDYWTTGLNLRKKDIEPLFQAVKRTQGAAHVDLSHLLPGLARKLLFSYPDTAMLSQGSLPDCHWTTLNFFNYEPQNYYLDARSATSAVLENFEKTDPPYRIGDVLMFMDGEGFARHSCNYVAADIVFTKNGRNPAIPWTLMELADLRKIYLVDTGETRIQGYRHRKAIAAGK